MIRHVIEENLEKRYFRDLEYRLLNGSLSNDEENEVAGMHGLNDAEIYRVVTFRMDAKKNMEKFTNAQIKETEMVENEIIRYLPRKHIFLQTNQIVYIHRETEQENKIDVTSMNCRTSKQGTATISMSFDIKGLEQLRHLVEKLRNVEGVLDIERTNS